LGYALFLWFAIRPLFQKLVSESKHDHGDSQTNVFIVFITMILSAWYGLILSRFTQAIGVHAIFGAFLTGLMVPHERGFAIAITEKIEDLISILFLPLYFAYSGLNTRLSELSDGQTWGFVFLVILVACGGKIIGCTLAARYAHMTWRESVTVGLLMNTKGLVEIIVLNLGLEANLITDKVFAIFLIMALTTTFMTVPCVSWVYPMTMYQHNDYGEEEEEEDGKTIMVRNSSQRSIKDTFRIVVCLPSMRTVPAIMNLNHQVEKSTCIVYVCWNWVIECLKL
jgi:Kef-type K+ transport system membrane component KefB